MNRATQARGYHRDRNAKDHPRHSKATLDTLKATLDSVFFCASPTCLGLQVADNADESRTLMQEALVAEEERRDLEAKSELGQRAEVPACLAS